MFYKVRHRETGLFWKGGGMNSNNHSMSSINIRSSKFYNEKLDKNSKEHALDICFSKTGKVWARKNHVTTALKYGQEPGLQKLLTEDCEIIEYPEKQLTVEDLRKIFDSGVRAAHLVWAEGIIDIDFDDIFNKTIKGEYLEFPE